MLILPLIFWWAKSPFRFAHGQIRGVILVAMVLLQSAVVAQDPLRSVADDGRADSPSLRRVVADLERTRLGDDGVDWESGQWDPDAPVKASVRHREDTRVPATPGRIVAVGRRWAFIPVAGDAAPFNPSSQVSNRDSPAEFGTSQSRPERFGSSFATGDSATRSVAANRAAAEDRSISSGAGGPAGSQLPSTLGGYQTTEGPGSTGPMGTANERPDARLRLVDDEFGPLTGAAGLPVRSQSAIPHSYVLLENLALSRIVDSIRRDPTDDAWIVTGRLTEFGDENYLLLETSRRSNAAPISGSLLSPNR